MEHAAPASGRKQQTRVTGPAGNRSLERGLAILAALAERRQARLKELCADVGLGGATVLRFLGTLEGLGYVRQDGGVWRLTRRLAALGARAGGGDLQRLQELLQELADRCGKTAFYVVEDRGDALYLHRALPRSAGLVSTQRIGRRAPLYCTGVGKVFLSARDDAAVEAYLARTPLLPLTQRTLTTAEALRAALATVRARGVALDDQECELGVSCIAAPVRDADGRVVAAISVTGATVQFTEAHSRELVVALQEAAARIAEEVDLEALR